MFVARFRVARWKRATSLMADEVRQSLQFTYSVLSG